jgi:hypothetical protein
VNWSVCRAELRFIFQGDFVVLPPAFWPDKEDYEVVLETLRLLVENLPRVHHNPARLNDMISRVTTASNSKPLSDPTRATYWFDRRGMPRVALEQRFQALENDPRRFLGKLYAIEFFERFWLDNRDFNGAILDIFVHPERHHAKPLLILQVATGYYFVKDDSLYIMQLLAANEKLSAKFSDRVAELLFLELPNHQET